MKTFLLLLGVVIPILDALGDASVPSAYVGQETRAIKALSDDDVAGYLAGRGMGLARPAELNGYPGPRHALNAAAELQLSAPQVAALQQIFAAMQAAAIPLGQLVVEKEAELDHRFAHRHIDEEGLARLTTEIARLQGELRAVHLRAHLATARELSPAQLEAYNRLRGYGPDSAPAHHPAGQHSPAP